jgi:hypothetical protein
MRREERTDMMEYGQVRFGMPVEGFETGEEGLPRKRQTECLEEFRGVEGFHHAKRLDAGHIKLGAIPIGRLHDP